MTPTLLTDDLITDDTGIDLLTPTDPSVMREMASFHANALLRHVLTLASQNDQDDAHWLADIQSCLAGIAEVMQG